MEGRKRRKTRGPSFSSAEIGHLGQAYCHATLNGIDGACQPSDVYYRSILDHLATFAPPDANVKKIYHYREQDSVATKLSKIMKDCQKFNTSLRLIILSKPTGVDKQQIINMAVAVHLKQCQGKNYDFKDFDAAGNWSYYQAWHHLRHLRKFSIDWETGAIPDEDPIATRPIATLAAPTALATAALPLAPATGDVTGSAATALGATASVATLGSNALGATGAATGFHPPDIGPPVGAPLLTMTNASRLKSRRRGGRDMSKQEEAKRVRKEAKVDQEAAKDRRLQQLECSMRENRELNQCRLEEQQRANAIFSINAAYNANQDNPEIKDELADMLVVAARTGFAFLQSSASQSSAAQSSAAQSSAAQSSATQSSAAQKRSLLELDDETANNTDQRAGKQSVRSTTTGDKSQEIVLLNDSSNGDDDDDTSSDTV